MWLRGLQLLVRAFVRAQLIAAPVGLLLTLMDAIYPDRTALTINQTLTFGWILSSLAATVFFLAAVEA